MWYCGWYVARLMMKVETCLLLLLLVGLPLPVDRNQLEYTTQVTKSFADVVC